MKKTSDFYIEPLNREEWLKARENGIGGSDAACIIGKSKWKTNTDLWYEKKGLKLADDISESPAVKYGKEAEQYVRALFELDNPEYSVDYHEFRMYQNYDHPFIFATLDGELTDADGNKGILEIKTTTLQNSRQLIEWNDRIPDYYYAQVLHQLLATGWDFVILKARIRRTTFHGDLIITEKQYDIRRKDVIADMSYLLRNEIKFWESLSGTTPPDLKLPDI